MDTEILSAVDLVDSFLARASAAKASDIHIDPQESKVLVRLRIDGILHDVTTYRLSIHGEIIARIKVLAGLKLDEHYSPQDGRFRVASVYDIRVVVTPSYFGEAVVMRLLRPYDQETTLTTLGFSTIDSARIALSLSRLSGLVLVAGPTGSGKTTTLYTLLRETISADRSVVTIEDPVEYILPGARQIPVRADRMSFATVLRSVLRQDPNIIMVGEIRDKETAQVAIAAALTGHFVLSTIHTKSAEGALIRLANMGIEQYMIDATVSLIIAQRLLQRICTQCRVSYVPMPAEIDFVEKIIGVRPQTLMRGAGCEYCKGTGFVGRFAVYEYIQSSRETPSRSLVEDGVRKACDGEVSLEHVMAFV